MSMLSFSFFALKSYKYIYNIYVNINKIIIKCKYNLITLYIQTYTPHLFVFLTKKQDYTNIEQ